MRIFKIATGRLPEKYQGCQILRQTRLKKKKIWGSWSRSRFQPLDRYQSRTETFWDFPAESGPGQEVRYLSRKKLLKLYNWRLKPMQYWDLLNYCVCVTLFVIPPYLFKTTSCKYKSFQIIIFEWIAQKTYTYLRP